MSAPPPVLQLATLAGCGLAIGGYPRFRYDARSGGGQGQLGPDVGDGRRSLRFDPARLRIPPLSWRTTRFLGLPLPPGLAIEIEPELLSGHLEPAGGALELHFRSRFHFRLGSYRAAALLIDCPLRSALVQGCRLQARGTPLNAAGEALLVGVATVEPCGVAWLDRFLGLPDEALALLRCRLTPV